MFNSVSLNCYWFNRFGCFQVDIIINVKIYIAFSSASFGTLTLVYIS